MIFPLTNFLICHTHIIAPCAITIFRYDTSVVTLRAGNAWTINRNMKLIHVNNLSEPSQNKHAISYYLAQVQERLVELRGIKNIKKISIDWTSSAWKWVAGNLDATD